MRLKDKVAIVTGAGSGIGAEIALGYLKEGAKVVLVDINEKSAKQTALKSGLPENMWLVKKSDVSSRESIKRCIEASLEKFGRIDILVANAGITARQHLMDLTEEDFDRVMNINCKGVFLTSQEAARVMADQGQGIIIHMASLSSVSAPGHNLVAYGASKGAVLSMTRHMALDLGHMGIRVNAIAPGTIQTNLNKKRLSDPAEVKKDEKKSMIGRIGGPEDLVGAAIFLAMEESSFMTGSHITIDGGETAQ